MKEVSAESGPKPRDGPAGDAGGEVGADGVGAEATGEADGGGSDAAGSGGKGKQGKAKAEEKASRLLNLDEDADPDDLLDD